MVGKVGCEVTNQKQKIGEVSEVDDQGSEKRRVPQDEAKISELTNKVFAVQSCKKIRWAVKMYNEWRVNRLKEVLVPVEIRRCDLKFPQDFNENDLCYTLIRFIREVRKLDNTEFPPNTLREIIVMLQMDLQQKGVYWKLLDGEKFSDLWNVVDNTMKERHAMGLGVRQPSSIISLAHEDKMFLCRALGEENPEQLLRTVIYMLGLHLALRGGVEHLRLRRPGFETQISTEVDNDSGQEVLLYREDPLQKTNQGGLIGKPKSSCQSVSFNKY